VAGLQEQSGLGFILHCFATLHSFGMLQTKRCLYLESLIHAYDPSKLCVVYISGGPQTSGFVGITAARRQLIYVCICAGYLFVDWSNMDLDGAIQLNVSKGWTLIK